MKIKTTGALGAVLLPMLLGSTAVWAAPAHKFMVSGLALKISPAEKNDPVVSDNPLLPNPTGLDLSADSNTLPALGLTYWLMDNIVLETYLSVPSNHHIAISGLEAYGINGFNQVASADLLPVTVFAHYLYQIPDTRFTLTAGAGLVYAIFRNIKVDEKILTQLDPTLKFEADNALGAALQVGAFVDITPEIVARISYSTMMFSADATVKTATPFGNLTTSLTVDPDVFMAGVGYKF